MPKPSDKRISTTALGALVFLLLSLVTLVVGVVMASLLVVTGAVVIGLAATTTAVLSLRED